LRFLFRLIGRRGLVAGLGRFDFRRLLAQRLALALIGDGRR
jgi:hypothetical protein